MKIVIDRDGLQARHHLRDDLRLGARFIGTDGAAYAGLGLIGHGHNQRFALRALRWLAGKLTH